MLRASTELGDDQLRSVHTTNFPQLLSQLGASLLVTTYQAGKLVLLRNDKGVLKEVPMSPVGWQWRPHFVALIIVEPRELELRRQ
jgi:hypothetical protein